MRYLIRYLVPCIRYILYLIIYFIFIEYTIFHFSFTKRSRGTSWKRSSPLRTIGNHVEPHSWLVLGIQDENEVFFITKLLSFANLIADQFQVFNMDMKYFILLNYCRPPTSFFSSPLAPFFWWTGEFHHRDKSISYILCAVLIRTRSPKIQSAVEKIINTTIN